MRISMHRILKYNRLNPNLQLSRILPRTLPLGKYTILRLLWLNGRHLLSTLLYTSWNFFCTKSFLCGTYINSSLLRHGALIKYCSALQGFSKILYRALYRAVHGALYKVLLKLYTESYIRLCCTEVLYIMALHKALYIETPRIQ